MGRAIGRVGVGPLRAGRWGGHRIGRRSAPRGNGGHGAFRSGREVWGCSGSSEILVVTDGQIGRRDIPVELA